MKTRAALLFPVVSLLLSGCSNIKYNGNFYDDLEEKLTQSFLDEHKINTSSSQNDLPRQIIYVVDSLEKYNAAFKGDYKIDINYEKELMFLCSFVSTYKIDHHLSSLEIKDNVLTIECDYKKGIPGTGYACTPYQRWCAVTMSKVEYQSTIFIGEGR